MLRKGVSKALAHAESSLILPQPYKLFSKKLLHPPTPTHVHRPSGYQLFQKVADYNADYNNKRVWKELDEEQKKAFESPDPIIHHHYSRIQNGYQSASSSLDCFNPFYEASLYPWEIIKDKLRHKPHFATDIYDQLIHEALSPKKGPFQPANLYYSEVLFRDSQLDSSITAFGDLSQETKALYQNISEKKIHFQERFREFYKAKKRPMTPYDEFVRQNQNKAASGSLMERNKALAQMWKDHQQSHQATHLPNKTRAFRERNLDINTCIVMDYIFEVGSVEDFHGNWRTWKHSVIGTAHYFRQAVFPYILQRRDRKVTFLEEYSEFDSLQTWKFEPKKK